MLTLAKSTGEWHPLLQREEEAPTALIYLFEAFLDMSAGRQIGLGAQPISELQMYFWQKLHGFPLRAWELTAIRKMDAAWLRVRADSYQGPEDDE